MPTDHAGIQSLVEGVEGQLRRAEAGTNAGAQRIAARLRDSVLRPLRQIEPQLSSPSTQDAAVPGDALIQLARAATRMLADHPEVPELAEATAALQDLAISAADGSHADALLAELQALQAALPSRIQVARDGPYLVTNPRHLYDWLGQPLPVGPQMALCRCGASRIKPLCDGSHARIGFSGAKDPNRVPDRRDTYVGQSVTVLDNRGTCQHSGYCTDRAPTVFHLGSEPFVTPSGGRMDEIVRVVRDCPSGALSYAKDGAEARADTDFHGTREPAVVVSKDGPYRVSGAFPLVDEAGVDVARNQGASREHLALCRCGHSQNKPFCSGMHWYIDFRDPVTPPDHVPTVFEWAGGYPQLVRMTRLFYEKHIPEDPLLAPLFATMAPDHPERVARWLAEVFGGPERYSEDYGGYPRMLGQHVGKALTEEQRARWVSLLLQSAREAQLPNDPEFAAAFQAYIEWGSRLAVENSQPGAEPPAHMPMPHWDWTTAAGPPGSRISAAPQPEEDDVMPDLPEEGAPLGFESTIKQLFRPSDVRSMSFAFDLGSYDDVRRHADGILARLRAGNMPCDGAWPEAQIDVFARWIEAGKPA